MAGAKGTRIVQAARVQIGDVYRADYISLTYPNGDVPRGTGACTDVVIRALRGVGVDLQSRVHTDMKANFASYPRRWGLRRPDPNIDHRRVPNLQTFWRRQGAAMSGGTWLPGDVVTWMLPNGRDHCGIISDTRGSSGQPTVIHNLSRCAEEDCLYTWRITGHYRYPRGL